MGLSHFTDEENKAQRRQDLEPHAASVRQQDGQSDVASLKQSQPSECQQLGSLFLVFKKKPDL